MRIMKIMRTSVLMLELSSTSVPPRNRPRGAGFPRTIIGEWFSREVER